MTWLDGEGVVVAFGVDAAPAVDDALAGDGRPASDEASVAGCVDIPSQKL